MKAPVYPEYVPLLHAARVLGRPVKWCDERTESFVSDQHGRGSVVEAALALDQDGRFLAVLLEGKSEQEKLSASQIDVVLGFDQELKRKLAAPQ